MYFFYFKKKRCISQKIEKEIKFTISQKGKLKKKRKNKVLPLSINQRKKKCKKDKIIKQNNKSQKSNTLKKGKTKKLRKNGLQKRRKNNSKSLITIKKSKETTIIRGITLIKAGITIKEAIIKITRITNREKGSKSDTSVVNGRKLRLLLRFRIFQRRKSF